VVPTGRGWSRSENASTMSASSAGISAAR
jgi:hypothetical protein